ncbi:hypothetical protein [Pyrobaculum islandicum]|uniref:hypothetical protein n=1 Tax=Pyrobaculum islandicum TaxID=2277 RepID=UPI001432901F|nr:hypothetical protein [Pyrobaculum islandicum]
MEVPLTAGLIVDEVESEASSLHAAARHEGVHHYVGGTPLFPRHLVGFLYLRAQLGASDGGYLRLRRWGFVTA